MNLVFVNNLHSILLKLTNKAEQPLKLKENFNNIIKKVKYKRMYLQNILKNKKKIKQMKRTD